MFKDFYWSNYVDGVKFGSTEFKLIDPDGGRFYSIFDSGSAHITVPKSQFNRFLEELILASDKPQYFTKEGVTFVDCFMTGTFSPFSFLVDGKWIEVDPYDYIWDVYQDGSTCILMVNQHEYNFFVLGLPVFHGYYTTHDMVNS